MAGVMLFERPVKTIKQSSRALFIEVAFRSLFVGHRKNQRLKQFRAFPNHMRLLNLQQGYVSLI